MNNKEVKDLVAIQQYKLAWYRKALHKLREDNLTLRAHLEEIVENPEIAQTIARVCLSTTIPNLD